ncbi:MAG: aspartate-alanine antiporter [Bacteroidales bacterium]|nr:aspartate-alanine antiporter [Bacteroidales bacterium]
MQFIGDILREYPAIALFLTVGLGFFFGRLKYKAFSLGSVTAGLLVGIIIGQLFGVKISDQIKNVFFMLFLFSIGYSVGPGFFRSLKGVGLKQALFALIMGFGCFASTLAVGKLMHYGPGEIVGLFGGSQTCSSLLGVGSEAIQNSTMTAAEKAAQIDIIPVCYAVTYVFGTLGTVVILSIIGPRLLGGMEKINRETAQLQSQYSSSPWRDDPAYVAAQTPVAYRSFKVSDPMFDGGITVKEAEKRLHKQGIHIFIDRIQNADDRKIRTARADRMIHPGDVVIVSGRMESMVMAANFIGEEIANAGQLNFPVKQAPVLLRNKDFAGQPLKALLEQRFMHGVIVKELERGGKVMEITPDDVLRRGDIITLVGHRHSLNGAAKKIGHLDRPTTHTDIMFLCLALCVSATFGTLTVYLGGVPVSFGTSGGSLIGGLVFGWLRSRRPTYGKIPRSVVWLLNQLGLNVFIAAVGINCGPQFISGIKAVGWMLPIVGAVATTIPLFLGLWLGRYVFKLPAVFTLGCCAGTRTCTAALGAVQDSLNTTLPTIAYTITYAVSNILLIFWGLLATIL